jgi:hypothetical protein
MYSELISSAIATGGPHASKTTAVKLMRRWAGRVGYICMLLILQRIKEFKDLKCLQPCV